MKERREKYEQIKTYLPEGMRNEKIDKKALTKEILYNIWKRMDVRGEY